MAAEGLADLGAGSQIPHNLRSSPPVTTTGRPETSTVAAAVARYIGERPLNSLEHGLGQLVEQSTRRVLLHGVERLRHQSDAGGVRAANQRSWHGFSSLIGSMRTAAGP